MHRIKKFFDERGKRGFLDWDLEERDQWLKTRGFIEESAPVHIVVGEDE